MASVIDIHLAGIEAADNQESQRNRWLWRHNLGDGREVVVSGMIFNARICIGPDDLLAYDEGWCYANPSTAMLAAAKWVAGGCEGEPVGWIKNLQTGETRLDD